MLPNSSAQRSYRSDKEPAYRCNESAVYPRYPYGKGGDIMTYLLTFLVSVAANLASDIMSRFICKWLDRYDDDRKPN